MPTPSSFGATSFPVIERPASFQPTLIQGPRPSVKIVGSPSTFHSIATTSFSSPALRSLLCATSRCPSAVSAGTAATSVQWAGTFVWENVLSSRTASAKSASGSTSAARAAASSSSTTQGRCLTLAPR